MRHALASLIVVLGCQTLAMSAGPAKTIYDFTVQDIDGKKVKLSKFKGKTLLVVNVASKCGFTPQYEALQALYKDMKDKGVVVLGFPANNFGSQEPGTNPEIKEFCTSKFGVTFPMFAKISVKGEDQADLYKWLIANSDRPNDDIEWNFTKFVVDKHGHVVKRFKPQTKPSDADLKEALVEASK